MSAVKQQLTPRAPFADLPFAATVGGGVTACNRDGLGLATVLARKSQIEALAQGVREHFRIELPLEPQRVAAGDVAFIGTGPGSWLATGEGGGNAFVRSLKQTLGELVSVSDQSDGYAVLRLSGPRVRDTLAKLIPLDVHPRAFPIGKAA